MNSCMGFHYKLVSYEISFKILTRLRLSSFIRAHYDKRLFMIDRFLLFINYSSSKYFEFLDNDYR